MSFYFYSSPSLKSTATLDFASSSGTTSALVSSATNRNALGLLRHLTLKRKNFLALLSKTTTTPVELDEAILQYLSSFLGLSQSIKGSEVKSLRRCGIKYHWVNTIGEPISENDDVMFEIFSMTVNYAFWYLKKYNQVDKIDLDYDMDKVTTLFRHMKLVAGVFYCLDNSPEFVNAPPAQISEDPGKKDPSNQPPSNQSSTLSEPTPSTLETNGDVQKDLIHVYYLQAIAQAMEISIQIGIKRKSPPTYLSNVSHDIANKYLEATKLLAKLKLDRCENLFYYLRSKFDAYMAYAYAFLGMSCINETDCGHAAPLINKAQTFLERSIQSGNSNELVRKKKIGVSFYYSLQRFISEGKKKAEMENSLIYKKKAVAVDDLKNLGAPSQPIKVDAEFVFPSVDSELWTNEMSSAFVFKS